MTTTTRGALNARPIALPRLTLGRIRTEPGTGTRGRRHAQVPTTTSVPAKRTVTSDGPADIEDRRRGSARPKALRMRNRVRHQVSAPTADRQVDRPTVSSPPWSLYRPRTFTSRWRQPGRVTM